ncbi:uncharacterized protein DUF4350 [Marinobacterium halophilum]|uniref:Uncharacterized protein DUF4350 n=1 Tax=Marinobacterium halophilum TaxID=267374 RepID=A0A2P8EXJ5_9GAMM|nr:DUF4350 domain-containing protein [Marinobacterium halophilum]PSL14145.1 uncharacterized protein DUF4350 [Marinobacterium halophilum]
MHMILFRVLPVLLLMLLGYVLVTGLESVDQVVDQGPGEEVRRNQFLAAGQLLEQQGLQVEHSRYPVAVNQLGPRDSLLLTSAEYLLDEPERVDVLLDWVASGGQLIWHYRSEMEQHPLAQALGVSHAPPELNKQALNDKVAAAELSETVHEAAAQFAQAPQESAPPSLSEQVMVDIRRREAGVATTALSRFAPADNARIYSPLESPLQWHENGRFGIEMQLEARSLPVERTSLLMLRLGNGRVSVLRNISIWDNDRIGLFDHAYLLLWLNRDRPVVHIQRYSQWPSLSLLLLDHAVEALTVGIFLLLGWLLYRGRRFGPVLHSSPQQRRTLNEHIEAVARFHHRHGQLNYLLAPLRRQVLNRAARLQGGLEQLPDKLQLAAVAEQAQLPLEQVRQALTPQEHYNSTDLVETVQLLLNIRKRL